MTPWNIASEPSPGQGPILQTPIHNAATQDASHTESTLISTLVCSSFHKVEVKRLKDSIRSIPKIILIQQYTITRMYVLIQWTKKRTCSRFDRTTANPHMHAKKQKLESVERGKYPIRFRRTPRPKAAYNGQLR